MSRTQGPVVGLGDLGAAAAIGGMLVLPFMVLERINRQGFAEGFPGVLFVAMWLLTALFILMVKPLLRMRSAEHRSPGLYLRLLARVMLMALIGWLWMSLVLDQMPCFLGVPNCD